MNPELIIHAYRSRCGNCGARMVAGNAGDTPLGECDTCGWKVNKVPILDEQADPNLIAEITVHLRGQVTVSLAGPEYPEGIEEPGRDDPNRVVNALRELTRHLIHAGEEIGRAKRVAQSIADMLEP